LRVINEELKIPGLEKVFLTQMGVMPALLGTRAQTWDGGLPSVCAKIILSFFFLQTVPETQEEVVIGFRNFAWA
jgi:hypothetical protein